MEGFAQTDVYNKRFANLVPAGYVPAEQYGGGVQWQFHQGLDFMSSENA
jgi:hypothetical protein